MRKKRNIWDHLSPDRLPCSIKKCFLLIKFPICPRKKNVLLIFSFNSQIYMCLIKVFGKSNGRFATIVLSLHSWLQKQEVTWICHTGYESLGSQVSWVIKSQLGEKSGLTACPGLHSCWLHPLSLGSGLAMWQPHPLAWTCRADEAE